MASNTTATTNKRKWHLAKQGRKRKNQEARHSTPSYGELFAGCGEPGKPVGRPTVKAAAKPPTIPAAKPPAVPKAKA